MPARFSKAYEEKIRKAVTRYQKERTKLVRKGMFENVPKRITYRELINQNYTKREMNKALKEMSLFTASKATKTVKIHGKVSTQYEVEKFRLILGRERKATARELEAMTAFETNYPTYHDRYLKRLQARSKELNKSWKELIGTRAGAEVLLKGEKSENMYSNWINALFQDAEKLGFSKEKMNEIIKEFNKLTPQQFERMYYEDPAIGYIFSFYNAEVKGQGEIDNTLARDAFESMYSRLGDTIKRYSKIKK